MVFMARTLDAIIAQAKMQVLSDLPEKPEDIATYLLAYAGSLHQQGDEASEGVKDVDAQYVEEQVAYPFRIASLARQLVLELVLDHHIQPSQL